MSISAAVSIDSPARDDLDAQWSRTRRGVLRRHRKLLGTLEKAAQQTGRATADYASFVADEAAGWRAFAARRREALRAPALRKSLWLGVHRTLGGLQDRIAEHVAELDRRSLAEPATEQLPVEDYDALTARRLIALVGDLDAERCRAVERYERAHKNRKTVLRAVERRLAAAC